MAIFGDLQRILGHESMTEMVRKRAPSAKLAQSEIVTRRETVNTPTFVWDIERVPNVPARWSAIGAKATRIPRVKVGIGTGVIAEINEYTDLEKKDILYLREPGTEHEVNLTRKLTEAQGMLLDRIEQRVEVACWEMLAGSISYDYSGEDSQPLKMPGSQFPITNFNSPAVSDWLSNFGDESVSASPGAPIISSDQLDIERYYSDANLGMEIKRAYANVKTARLLSKNVELRHWYKETNNKMLTSAQFDSLGGWAFRYWDKGYRATVAADEAGTVTRFIPDNVMYLLPAGNEMQATIVEGPNIVPKGAIEANATSTFDTVKSGVVSWAEFVSNPHVIRIYVSYAFGVYMKWPELVMKMTLR